MNFREKIRKHRFELGISRVALGEAIGTSDKTVERWEEGGEEDRGNEPRVWQLRALAELFRVPVIYLIDDAMETPDAAASGLAPAGGDDPVVGLRRRAGVVLTGDEERVVAHARRLGVERAARLLDLIEMMGYEVAVSRLMGLAMPPVEGGGHQGVGGLAVGHGRGGPIPRPDHPVAHEKPVKRRK